MKNKLREPFMCYDSVFKSVFMGNENILSKMICDISGFNYALLENNLVLDTNEISIDRFNEKFKKCDFIAKIADNNIINLELNPKSYPGLVIKNLSYVFHLFKTYSTKGEEYDNNLFVSQININNFDINDKVLSKFLIKEEESNDIYTESLKIFALSIVKCREIYYNNLGKDVPRYIKWGAFLSCMVEEKDKMENILCELLPESEVKMIMDKINKVSEDSLFMSKEERQKWQDWEDKSIIKYEKQLAREEGLAEGINSVIKSMLKKNMSYEDISDITGKSVDEIKKIADNLN